ncbi:Disease resistance protein CC-NBS-LRR class family [Prunus dulcis]|uniref:Disease resistance protein CC-NBS-LRR class family n=1 Tax=Prunus dulcis TaxID=3755 RepID=A0A4Y1QSK0_PRUDU|nr:Disease resistance protein CC-NBS-LRR class family [Prunus dulcis]
MVYGKAQTSHVPRNVESTCHGCGAKGHWARVCRTPKHLTDLYQASLKNRKVETNYIDHAISDPLATDGSSEISRMDVNYGCLQNKGYGKDICLADSATTHTILRDRKYFSKLMLTKAKVTTISGPADLIEGSGTTQIMLPNGTILSIQNALYSSNSRRNLLSFKDIRLNGYHVETKNEKNMEYLCITSSDTQKRILEKLCVLSSRLYYKP